MWEEERTPGKWRKGLTVKLPKKGNMKESNNWLSLSLLPVVSKVLGKPVIEKIRSGVDSKLRKEQAGLKRGRGTTKQTFALHCTSTSWALRNRISPQRQPVVSYAKLGYNQDNQHGESTLQRL